MIEKNYYELLGVRADASSAEIKRAYHRLARKYHPDMGGDEGTEYIFQRIVEAYSILSDDSKRNEYDLENGFSVQAQTEYEPYRPGQNSRSSQSSHKAHTNQSSSDNAENTKSNPQEDQSDRAWDFLDNKPNQKDEFSGLNNMRYSSTKAPTSPESSNLREKLKSLFSPLRQKTKDDVEEGARFFRSPDTMRGQRHYAFSIDALESLHGAKREIVLSEEDGPRRIAVHIPPGVVHGATLSILAPRYRDTPEQKLSVSIQVTPHPNVEREGLDIIVKVPITVSEALIGIEVEVPTLAGPSRVKIPPQTLNAKRLRLKGRGVKDEATGNAGDLYVRPFIAPPDMNNDLSQEAAKNLERFYTADVRKGFLSKL